MSPLDRLLVRELGWLTARPTDAEIVQHLARRNRMGGLAAAGMIIRLIIQTILLYPSGAVWTDGPPDVSSLDPSGAIQIDAEHPTRNGRARHFTIAGMTPWQCL
jgi:hypothetical protein